MPAKTTSSKSPEWMLATGIAMATVLTVAGVWAYANNAFSPKMERPQPAWLEIARATPQLADGRTLAVQVGLEFDSQDAVKELTPHVDAFQAVVIDAAQSMSHRDLRGTKGIRRLGDAIEEGINDYLQDKHIKERLRQVAFEEMLLMP